MKQRNEHNDLVLIFLALFFVTCLVNCANPPGSPPDYVAVPGPVGPVGPSGPQGPVGPQGPAAPVPAAPVVAYQGCYLDTSSRALPNWITVSPITVETCTAVGKALGYKYVGLQDSGQCFGGNAVGFTQVPESDCNMPCIDNPSEMCGGIWRNSVYSTGL